MVCAVASFPMAIVGVYVSLIEAYAPGLDQAKTPLTFVTPPRVVTGEESK